MPCIVTVGGFYGDEGKGKIIVYLAINENYSVAARGGVGPNAGHTFVQNNVEHKVRMLPSAVLNKDTTTINWCGCPCGTHYSLKRNRYFSCDRPNIH